MQLKPGIYGLHSGARRRLQHHQPPLDLPRGEGGAAARMMSWGLRRQQQKRTHGSFRPTAQVLPANVLHNAISLPGSSAPPRSPHVSPSVSRGSQPALHASETTMPRVALASRKWTRTFHAVVRLLLDLRLRPRLAHPLHQGLQPRPTATLASRMAMGPHASPSARHAEAHAPAASMGGAGKPAPRGAVLPLLTAPGHASETHWAGTFHVFTPVAPKTCGVCDMCETLLSRSRQACPFIQKSWSRQPHRTHPGNPLMPGRAPGEAAC